jgi:hypothetical protein
MKDFRIPQSGTIRAHQLFVHFSHSLLSELGVARVAIASDLATTDPAWSDISLERTREGIVTLRYARPVRRCTFAVHNNDVLSLSKATIIAYTRDMTVHHLVVTELPGGRQSWKYAIANSGQLKYSFMVEGDTVVRYSISANGILKESYVNPHFPREGSTRERTWDRHR